MRHRRSALLIALAVCLALPGSSLAQSEPFAYTPAGWTWWRGGGGSVLLPSDAATGDQGRFFLVASGALVQDWLPGWVGGGEIRWQGTITLGGGQWQAQLVAGQGHRGLTGADGSRSFAAVSPEGRWAKDAGDYNAVLRGGADGR